MEKKKIEQPTKNKTEGIPQINKQKLLNEVFLWADRIQVPNGHKRDLKAIIDKYVE